MAMQSGLCIRFARFAVAFAVVANAGAAQPTRLSDAEFWKLVTDISEPGGYFRITDNFTSNEREVGQLFSMLRSSGVAGGVYMGVGPEQNFTYIASIRPKMAFVVDIRRQAVMQHLMSKAMFELSKDRADFIALLFSRARPGGLDSTTAIDRIWDAFWNVAPDTATATRNLTRVVDHLTKAHHFTFTEQEMGQLKSVMQAFVSYGPSISTRGAPGGRGNFGGGFADMTGYSPDSTGRAQSFLSSEENFRTVKSLQEKNLVVPVSGDFGGPKAIRAIGTWLKEQGGVVSAFYVSNVEQYLFQDEKGRAFYENVATLPVDARSVFVRPYSMRRGYGGPMRSLCPIAPFIRAALAGRILTNNDALECVQ